MLMVMLAKAGIPCYRLDPDIGFKRITGKKKQNLERKGGEAG